MMTFAERVAPLLAKGIAVFPCRQDKRPLTPHGFKDATTDRTQVEAWSAQWPDALVAVRTGNDAGIFVLDVDVRSDKNGFDTLKAHGWTLPETRTHRTKSGGVHCFFRYPEGVSLKNSAGKLGPGVDTRGDGGYVIRWDLHDCDVEHPDTLADVPDWLLDALTNTNQNPGAKAVAVDGDVFPEGTRNISLCSAAGRLRAQGWSENAIEAAIQVLNIEKCVPPLPQEEVHTIAHSVGRYEARHDGNDTVAALAQLSPLEYDRVRLTEADKLGVRVSTLDKLVLEARGDAAGDNPSDALVATVEPWEYPVDGAALLSEITETIQRFIVCDEGTAHAAALWVALTWFIDVVNVAPLAVITAPEMRCGKSQLLAVLGRLVNRPMSASNITPAAMYRAVEAWKPTLLVDEADAFMRDNEELRGVVNSGHTRDSAYVVRTVGDDHTPAQFSTWGAKALAGIGRLAPTIMDRAIVLGLRRKLAYETTERLRHADPQTFEDLAAKLARFAQDNAEAVRSARPALPAVLNDRAQDNWEPLLAIAQTAGGQWPHLARDAALRLSGSEPEGATGDELLADIREVFDAHPGNKISTADLITFLCQDDEKPWATCNRGQRLSPHQLAYKLRAYGIRSRTVRIGGETPKGFERGQFDDAFARYLSSPTPPSGTATPQQTQENNHLGVALCKNTEAEKAQSATPNPLVLHDCCGVAGCDECLCATTATDEDAACGLV